ncbi:MAG: DinB family protein [Acidobacteriota bacterium]
MSDKHLSHAKLIERLKSQGEDVTRLCAELDEESFAKRLKPEQWSVKEVLAHIARLQQVFEGRLDAMLTQETPTIVGYEPEGDPEFAAIAKKSSGELLKWFQGTRSRLIGRLEKLSPQDWHRPGRHAEYPGYDVHFCMEYMGHHEAHHMYQMFERRASGEPRAR